MTTCWPLDAVLAQFLGRAGCSECNAVPGGAGLDFAGWCLVAGWCHGGGWRSRGWRRCLWFLNGKFSEAVSAVLAWFPPGVDIGWWPKPGQAGVLVEMHLPLGMFGLTRVWLNQSMMIRTQQDSISEGGLATLPPGHYVVGLTPRGRRAAAGEGAALVSF